MRAAEVRLNGKLAGILSKSKGIYRFVYDKDYLATPGSKAVSLTLPKQEAPYECDVLFPAGAPAYIVRRFDYKPDGTGKYLVEDFATPLAKTSEREESFKYNGTYLDIIPYLPKI